MSKNQFTKITIILQLSFHLVKYVHENVQKQEQIFLIKNHLKRVWLKGSHTLLSLVNTFFG